MNNKGYICLTADVHHMSLKTNDQKYLNISEVEAALQYVSIARDYGIKVTIFSTGKAVAEEYKNFVKLLKFQNIELGGHNYYAFRPKWLYGGIFNRLFCSSIGPAFYQDYEIKKTVKIFKSTLGIEIVSWRNHAYRHDAHTYELLSKNGIRFVSDAVEPDKIYPYRLGNLTFIPINVMPDHDHIYHADLTPKSSKGLKLERNKFPSKFYPVEQWLQIIKEHINFILDHNGIATILIHPACMKIIDEFNTFRKVCRFLAGCRSIFVSDLGKSEFFNF